MYCKYSVGISSYLANKLANGVNTLSEQAKIIPEETRGGTVQNDHFFKKTYKALTRQTLTTSRGTANPGTSALSSRQVEQQEHKRVFNQVLAGGLAFGRLHRKKKTTTREYPILYIQRKYGEFQVFS